MSTYGIEYKVGYIRDELTALNKNLKTLTETIKEEGRLNRLVTLIAAGVDPTQIDLTKIGA